MSGRIVTCACGCGKTGKHHARGMLYLCYKRRQSRGTLDLYPETRYRAQRTARKMLMRSDHIQDRADDWRGLTERQGYTNKQACEWIEVSERTGQRYRSHWDAVKKEEQMQLCQTCRGGDILVTPQGGCPDCKGIEEKRTEESSGRASDSKPEG